MRRDEHPEPAYALSRRFPARRALVFGAASGLGREVTGLLAASGWRVGAADRDRARLDELSATTPNHAFAVDVADPEAVNAVVESFVEACGGIDVLVNSAGIGAGGTFETVSLDIWREVIDVNLLGTVNACKAALPIMRRQRAGHIINIASAAAFHALPRVSAYNASKAGVLALSETLAAELYGSGIGITVKMSTFYRSRLPELTLGSEQDRELTRRLADSSGLDAAAVAERTLRAAGNGQLYLVTPALARAIWSIKRHAPRTYQRVLPELNKLLLSRLQRQRPAPPN